MLKAEVLEVRREPEVHELHVGPFLRLIRQYIVQLQVAMLGTEKNIYMKTAA